MGPHRPRWPRPSRRGWHERAARLRRSTVRAADLGDPGECARIDAFVARASRRRHVFHRPQWSRAVERGCGQRAHYLVAERGGALVGCLPLTEIRSPLFGNALVSAGFATGGGMLADGDERRRARWPRRAGRWPQRLGCRALELRGGPLPAGWTAQRRRLCQFRPRRCPATTRPARLDPAPAARRGAQARSSFELDVRIGRDDRASRRAFPRLCRERPQSRHAGLPARACSRRCSTNSATMPTSSPCRKDGRAARRRAQLLFQGHLSSPTGAAAPREARATARQRLALFRADAPGDRARLHPRRFRPLEGRHRRLAAQAELGVRAETPLVYGVRTADGAAPREINPLSPKYRLQVAAWQKLPLWLANRLGPLDRAGARLMRRHPVPRPPHPVSARPGRQDPLLAPAEGAGPSSAASISPASPTMRPTPPICRRCARRWASGSARSMSRCAATGKAAGRACARCSRASRSR